jgi:hypothetical protein
MVAIPTPPPATARALLSALETRQRRDMHPRLSASQLADCERRQWDAFRWLFPPEVFDGRKLSIFETGEVWETRLVARLREAGISVHDVDPDTGEQWRVVFAAGHASGRLDGEVEGLPEAPKTRHVLEVKTHNDRSFKALIKDGVEKAKPEHYAQMQTYMGQRGLTRALYLSVCKNDDSIWAERIEFDPAAHARLMARAEGIVTADRRPACSCAPHLLKHGYGCAANAAVMPVRTCRSCLHSTAHLDGDARWSCARWGRDLSLEEQKVGCPSHLFNPTAVPGEQVDADEVGEWVLYRLSDGSVWRDGGGA